MIHQQHSRCLWYGLIVGTACLCLSGCQTYYPVTEMNELDYAPVVELLPQQIQMSEAVLGPGDRIEMTVYRHNDLNRDILVPSSGIIFVPLIGEMSVEGVSATDLRRQISDALTEYIIDPQVSMNVSIQRSQKVTILGEVRAPGLYTLEKYRPTSALELITRAGGWNRQANKKEAILVRVVDGEPIKYILNLKQAATIGELSQNPQIIGGDILYVPSTLVADMDRWARHLIVWLEPLLRLEEAVLLGINIKDGVNEERPATGRVNTRTQSSIDFNIFDTIP